MDYLCARQAEHMRCTRRVGDPEEDPGMAQARPRLSEINRLGLLTVESQLGLDRRWLKQRAYLSGLATPEVAARLASRLKLLRGVLVLVFPHGEEAPAGYNEFGLRSMPRLEVTLAGSNLEPCTRVPLGAVRSFRSMWDNLLPELRAELVHAPDTARLQAAASAACQVLIVDTVWGRKNWLFDRVIQLCG